MKTETNRSSPWFTLWYKPGQTLQGLIAGGKGAGAAMLIAFCFGLVLVWPRYATLAASGPVLLLLGGTAALAGLFLFSWLLRNFSRWFGAPSVRLLELRTALGWGLLPWTVLPGLLLLFITTQEGDASRLFPFFFASFLYGFVILLTLLSTALRLRMMQTFFCLILTFLVSIFPLTFLLQLLFGPTLPTP